ncbi:hypothetical protein I4F81_012155 [Pyropia yezoensis]|uniref:Uncharacterized protein n=1 Tax=Pyropia yezoensis TaxID=2788 RepID=A0ACC3CHE2_PYRYE|nr:hypothetical protein I4F81_012155 [Neopyropia yezoensis]
MWRGNGDGGGYGGFGGGGFGGGFGGGGGGGFDLPDGAMPAAPMGAFTRQFRAFPVSFIDRADLDKGDKIILPPSALDTLARLAVSYPMQFQVSSAAGVTTHVGVLEFVAEEGRAYFPYWLLTSLAVAEGDMVTLRNAVLPRGTYVKFRPLSSDFLAISNPKAVLEASLRAFSCLSRGDSVAIAYNNKTYWIDVLDVKPGDAISIVEADVNVDFEAPLDYVEPAPVYRNTPASGAGSSSGAGGAGASAGAGSGSGGVALGGAGGTGASRLASRLERLKKRPPGGGGDSTDDSSDEDGAAAAKKAEAAKPRFPGSGQALKPRAGGASASRLLFGGGAAAAAATAPAVGPAAAEGVASTNGGTSAAAANGSGADAGLADNGEEKKEAKPFVPFGGAGRSLRD